MRGFAGLLALALVACIADETVVCGDLRCPVGSVCTAGGCATPAAVAACAALDEGDACSVGVCRGGACHPVICGDGLVELVEACDDTNGVDGDGCSAACDSTETCGNGATDLAVGEQCDDGFVGLSADGCSSVCRLEQMTWRDVTPRPISARAAAAVAYDVARARVVLFGGYDNTGTFADTWTSVDGSEWILHDPTTAPPARQHAAIAYDSDRERVVLFGGVAGAYHGDLWEWDGTTWVERVIPGPPPRAQAAMTYDVARKRIVLFGGTNGNSRLADTWEFDGTTWTERSPASSPTTRRAHSIAYDSTRQNVVLFGGLRGSGAVDDTWTWDGTTWTPIALATRPPTSWGHVLVDDPGRDRVVLVGAWSGTSSDRVWEWDGAAWNPTTPLQTPGVRMHQVAAYLEQIGKLMTFGGLRTVPGSSTVLGDSWLYDATTSTWDVVELGATSPRARIGASLAYDPRQGVAVLFGGYSFSEQLLFDDTWLWRSHRWQLLATSTPHPSARLGHGTVFCADQLVLFGGLDISGPLADTWTWRSSDGWMQRAPVDAPSARADHGIACDSTRGRVVLFGGTVQDPDGPALGETWEWDGTNWVERIVASSPGARWDHAMAYDPLRDRVVLFGGRSEDALFADTWQWDGASWERKQPATSPPGRYRPQLAYDPARRRLVMHGGFDGQVNNMGDIWEWDGEDWEQVIPIVQAPARQLHAMIYEDRYRRLVLFGGFGGVDAAGDTWIGARGTPDVAAERCFFATGDDDGDQLAGCDDPDCWGRCTPLCPPGAVCDPQAPRCGDGTCDAVEDYQLCPADCVPP